MRCGIKALFAMFAACAACTGHAGEIYKCVGAGVTSYQSMPCARGASQARLGIPTNPTTSPEARVVPAPAAAAPRTLRTGPWRNAALVLGISDDEVLNMPAWGRPDRIVRTRLARGWQEVWTYGNALVGGRELRFVNARLADLGDAPASAVALAPR